MLRAALWYGRHGFAIFPVARGKAPLTPHGFKDASADAGQISAWWTEHPDANIGVLCDAFFVVDVDLGRGGEIVQERWQREHGPFPRTWCARTGSGGLHYFFQHDFALDSIPLGTIYKGLEIKGGSRHYVLLAPSVNKKGAYTWIVKPTEPIAEAPRWLLDEIVTRKTRVEAPAAAPVTNIPSTDKVRRARAYARKIDPAISGSGGHNRTLRAAVLIARGFDLGEAEAFAVLASEFNPRCQPPWSPRDLLRKVKEAIRIGDMPRGKLLEAKAS